MLISNEVGAKEVSVKVVNIDTSKPGFILVMLFAKKGFPKAHNEALVVQRERADASELTLSFHVEEEQYAIKVLHDENGDGKTSKNWTGIYPSEGLGFTNGAKLGWTGPPSFKDAYLELKETKDEVIIPIIYP